MYSTSISLNIVEEIWVLKHAESFVPAPNWKLEVQYPA